MMDVIEGYETPEQIKSTFYASNVDPIDPTNPPAWARAADGTWDILPPNLRTSDIIPHIPEYGIVPDKSIGYVPQSYAIHLAAGMTTWQGVITRESMRKYLYKGTNEISTGLKVCHVETFNTFEAAWMIPRSLTFEYPIPIEAGIPDMQTLTYWGYKMGLRKGGMSTMISDVSRVQNDIKQLERDISRRQTEAIAKAVDDNILPTLFGGSGGVLRDVRTNYKWDGSGSAQPDIIDDIARAQSALIIQSDLDEAEINTMRMKLVLPLIAKPYLNSRYSYVMGGTTATGITQSGSEKIISQIKAMDIDVFYTRNTYFDNDGMLLYKSPKVAIHGVYGGSEVPLMEQQRIFGEGTRVALWRYFNTKVAPKARGETTNLNIGLITDLFADE